MKVLAVADLHGDEGGVKNIQEFLEKNYDVLIIVGDITQFGPTARAKEILDKLEGKDVRILSIPGNCDPKGVLPVLEERNVNLHLKSVKLGDYTFAGIGGSNPTPFDTPFEIDEREIKENLISLSRNTESKWILVSHAPPHNTTIDLTSDNIHAGSKSIRKIIEERRPQLNICAHIHEARGIDNIGETEIVNPGPIFEGYAAEVEIDEAIEVNLIEL